MFTKRGWLIHLEKEAWSLVDTPSSRVAFAPEELAEQAPLIGQALVEAGYGGEPIVIGLAANLCLAATIDVPSPQMLKRPQVMHHQLEEWIPWSAEDFVSDFIGHRDSAFMVAVRHQELARLLRALEDEGHQIALIAPQTLLAVQQHLAEKNLPEEHWLLWQDEESVDFVAIAQGTPSQWSRVPATDVEVTQLLQMECLSQSSPSPIYEIGLSEELSNSLTAKGFQFQSLPEKNQLEAANDCIQNIAAGTDEPLINLRQGQLGSEQQFSAVAKELGRLKLVAALLLICVSAAFWIRAGHYKPATAGVHMELRGLHKKLFPEKRVPERVGPAIQSYLKQLQGTREPAVDLPPPAAADVVLERLLKSLPKEMRFRLPEIRIEGQRVYLGGEVRSNGDADLMAAALRKQGFSVDPPRTLRLADRGFSVRLHATAKGIDDE